MTPAHALFALVWWAAFFTLVVVVVLSAFAAVNALAERWLGEGWL